MAAKRIAFSAAGLDAKNADLAAIASGELNPPEIRRGRRKRGGGDAGPGQSNQESDVQATDSPMAVPKAEEDGVVAKKMLVHSLTDEACLEVLKNCGTCQAFLDALSNMSDQQRFVTKAIRAAGGKLECLDCGQTRDDTVAYIVHAKNCVAATAAGVLTEEQEPPKRRGRRAKASSVSKAATLPNYDDSLPTSSDIKEEPWTYLDLTAKQRNQYIDLEFLLKKSLTCPWCGQVFMERTDVKPHLDKCIKPEYHTYKDRLDDLRLKPDEELRRILRAAVHHGEQPCFVCSKMSAHPYLLRYHVTRCGIDPEQRPWRCHFCGYQTTQLLGHRHLSYECQVKAARYDKNNELIKEDVVIPADKVRGARKKSRRVVVDDSDEDGFQIEKKDPDFLLEPGNSVNPVTATVDVRIDNERNRELKQFLNDTPPMRLNQIGRVNRYHTGLACVSTGMIPERSSRITVGKGGALRFKFRKLDVSDTIPSIADRDRYVTAVMQAEDDWLRQMAKEPFCERLQKLKGVAWTACADDAYIKSLRKKQSVGFKEGKRPESTKTVVLATPIKIKGKAKATKEKKDQQTPRLHLLPQTELAPDLLHLGLGEGTIMQFEREIEEVNIIKKEVQWTGISYAGGPINSIDFSPNNLPDGSMVFALSTYPRDDTLTDTGTEWKSSSGYVQLWTIPQRNGIDTPTTPRLWAFIQTPTSCGIPLKVHWCPKPNAGDVRIVGFLAVATGGGYLLIYRVSLDSVPVLAEGEAPKVYAPDPVIVLEQDEASSVVEQRDSDGEEPQSPGLPPLISIAWSHFNGADRIAACNAAGFILIWELENEECALPIEMTSDAWMSPAVDVVWNSEKQVAVSFRERLLRVLDTDTGECILEEATVRTAGYRTSAQLRTFPGCFLFQSEVFANGDQVQSGVCYLVVDGKKQGYFVVPLANRHELFMFDAALCSGNGVLATCGVDGAISLSMNGRLAPVGSRSDFHFSVQKKALQLTSMRVDKPMADDEKAPPLYSTYDQVLENMWLEVNYADADKAPTKKVKYSSGDLRMESLTVVTTSFRPCPMVLCGGQAGLLFLKDCHF